MQEVVEYESYEDFNKARMAKLNAGWRIVNITDKQQRSGVGRFAALGLGALVIKPKPHVMVVYEK